MFNSTKNYDNALQRRMAKHNTRADKLFFDRLCAIYAMGHASQKMAAPTNDNTRSFCTALIIADFSVRMSATLSSSSAIQIKYADLPTN